MKGWGMENTDVGTIGKALEPKLSFRVHEPWFVTLFAMSTHLRKEANAPVAGGNDRLHAALRDYLDGYFLSLDFYPVCTRSIFARNDAFGLWSDFAKVWNDHSDTMGYMIDHPHLAVETEEHGIEQRQEGSVKTPSKGRSQSRPD
jgi:hypothetical protein